MSHYDCLECGEPMGVGFGVCPACTPPEYQKLDVERNKIWRQIVEKEMEAHRQYAHDLANLLTRDYTEKLKELSRLHREKTG